MKERTCENCTWIAAASEDSIKCEIDRVYHPRGYRCKCHAANAAEAAPVAEALERHMAWALKHMTPKTIDALGNVVGAGGEA